MITRELGHCFALRHNEDEGTVEVDLVQAHPGYSDWSNERNETTVADPFRPVYTLP